MQKSKAALEAIILHHMSDLIKVTHYGEKQKKTVMCEYPVGYFMQ